jgi:diguanylate cyclase (GGDEF)-like protein/PAS domain S-box-containing protein
MDTSPEPVCRGARVSHPLKILFLADAESDFRLITHHLEQRGLRAECIRVASAEGLATVLSQERIDLALVDYRVPGPEVQDCLARIRTDTPELPVILMSGSIGEEATVELLKQGVSDFVLKDSFARLVPAIERSLRDAAQRNVRREAEEQMRLAAVAFENTLEGIIVADAEHRIISVNRAFTQITGYMPAQVMGRDLSVLGASDQDGSFHGTMLACLAAHGKWHGEVLNRRCDGQNYPGWFNIVAVRDSDDRVTHYVGVLTDISERKAAQARIERMAHHDPLTDLPNRVLLLDRMRKAIAQAQRSNRPMAVLFVDLDHFKQVNDLLGHLIGDRVLIEVSRRLVGNVRAGDTVARLSGDEFVVLLPEAPGIEAVVRVVAGITDALAKPIRCEGQTIRLSASIGISLFPKDGREASGLLTRADHAMYEAKAAGRSTYRFFSPAMNAKAQERFRIQAALREALPRGQLRLFYQPQVDSRTVRVSAYEALLRWTYPQRGLLCPSAFLNVAEETGLIVPIGQWALKQACLQCSQWHAQGFRGSVALSLSARQFAQENLLESVTESLQAARLPGNFLELQLTQSLLVEPTEATMKLLRDLRQLGVRIAVAGFGTGYSSLGYLKRCPITTLKIAQPFVEDIEVESENRAIVQVMVTLARAMSLRTVAEGVEHGSQAKALREIGADLLQGEYFGQAAAAPELQRITESDQAV